MKLPPVATVYKSDDGKCVIAHPYNGVFILCFGDTETEVNKKFFEAWQRTGKKQ